MTQRRRINRLALVLASALAMALFVPAFAAAQYNEAPMLRALEVL